MTEIRQLVGILKAKGLTRTDICVRLGIGDQSLYRQESGKRKKINKAYIEVLEQMIKEIKNACLQKD